MKVKKKIGQTEKSKIRKSKEWNQLRIDVAARFDNKDAITGDKLKPGWNLHHVSQNADEYDDFTIENDFGIPRFLPLNRTTHEMIHSFYRSATRKKNPLNIEKFFNNMIQRLKEMIAMNKND